MTSRLVSVAVAVALDNAFTYAVPEHLELPPAGARVLVPLGARVLVGVVRAETAAPVAKGLKALLDVLDPEEPALTPALLQLCEWLSDYYLAPIGEVYRLALPGMLTHADARVVAITDTGRLALDAAGPLLGGTELQASERALLEAVAHSGATGLPMSKLVRTLKRGGASRVLGALEARGLVTAGWAQDDELRTETWVRRTDALRDGSGEDELQRVIGRSKQRRALLDELERRTDDDAGWVALGELRGPFPRVRELLPPLVGAQLVELDERARTLDPFAQTEPAAALPQTPTADQAQALTYLHGLLARGGFESVLLQGITGSGKTEVYLQLIASVRAQRRGAIVLVPEIALTPQLADRFRARFGDEVAVLHSGLTPRQRLDAWQQIRRGLRPIVIGARSAVFAPLPSLGVIVVDEEHDASFKQEDGVRYHGRDVALVRAKAAGVPVVLGSATPSLESYALAQAGRHHWLHLRQRPTPRPLPSVEVVPLSVHRPDPESLMTARLRQSIAECAGAGEQAIVFLNRRGFTTTLVCDQCGSFQQCPDCSAPSMTYHLQRHRLMCHLCGHIEATPDRCSSCGWHELSHGGVGTERVESALARELPGIRVLRLDRDATRGRALFDTLARFRAREADVLVGTQMLSKGHDFPGVTLVGILQGDHGLALPDVRAAERTFQLLTQVAGRAGRGDRPGRVIIQAWAVDHPAIACAQRHDVDGFAALELEQRRRLDNPPHGHLALVRVSGLGAAAVQARARALGQLASERIARLPSPDLVRLLGPVPSPIERIDRRTRWQLLLRARERSPLRWVLQALRPRLGAEGSGATQTHAFVDVDPYSML
ncbi:MAG: primosomal protein N' [Deltaproteobacteria bacterium]|nr:primosomal protein N' [Deltaproteobacteria bacterium]MBP7291582.1 primosomal protein N' [Nannocystaceae bacterium]